MKNVVTKSSYYRDIGFFNHIYFLDGEYEFNEKNVNDIVKFVKSEPFHPVLVHANNVSNDLIEVFRKISQEREIWFKTDKMFFEDFAVLGKEMLETLNFDKVSVMIDALDDVIDVKKSLKENSLIKFNYMELPF